jgi:hypothetical protein
LCADAARGDADARRAAPDGENEGALDRAIFPLLLILVNDEVPLVACTALRALAGADDDLGDDDRVVGLRALLEPHHVDKLSLSLSDLATSRHWRVRAAAARVAPALAACADAPAHVKATAALVATSVQDTPRIPGVFRLWRPVSRSVWVRFGSFLDR